MKKYIKTFTLMSFIAIALLGISGCDSNDIIRTEASGNLGFEFTFSQSSVTSLKQSHPKTEQNWPDQFDVHISITGEFNEINRTVTVTRIDSLTYQAQQPIEAPVETELFVFVSAEIDSQTWTGSQTVILSSDTAVTVPIQLNPSSYVDYELRTTLTWQANPTDLDLHVVTPVIGTASYHIYYLSKGSFSSIPFVYLDIDDMSGFGPETITIVQNFPGIYYVYVNNFSGDVELAGCGASVEIRDQFQVIQTLTIPATGFGEYWNLFTYDGQSGFLDIFNQISQTPLGP